MRRLLERVRPVCDLSLAASSSKETISPGTCSISDDSVLFAVWELQIKKWSLLAGKLLNFQFPTCSVCLCPSSPTIEFVLLYLLASNLKLELTDGHTVPKECGWQHDSLLNKSSVVRVVDVTNNWWGVFVVVTGGMS